MRDGELTLQTTKERGSIIQLHQLTQLVDTNQGGHGFEVHLS